MGGLGLTNAVQTRVAPHWASWANSISMVRKRHPTIAHAMIKGIDRNPPFFQSVKNCECVGRGWLGNPIVDRNGCDSIFSCDPDLTGPKFGRQKTLRHLQEKFHLDVASVLLRQMLR